jgi:hypothetical protein
VYVVLVAAHVSEPAATTVYGLITECNRHRNAYSDIPCIAEFQGSDSLPFQEQESGHHHANKQNDCQCR